MNKKNLLIVEDDYDLRKALFEGLSNNGYDISLAENGASALHLFDQKSFDLVMTDVRLPDQDGLQLLDTVKQRSAQTPVIVMTGFGTIQHAVTAMRKGAFDYLVKPFSLEIVDERIRAAIHRCALSGNAMSARETPEPPLPIIAQDRRTKETIEKCRKIAPSKATVLIQGESGTGKELIARYIHTQSPRREGTFIAVNCASLPETLFESELFGHEKGAFTGALTRKTGKFEMAHQGTILLDEISEMSTFLQAKILRVLQENEVDRIGGKEPVPVDIRVIATTNRNLEACIEKGEFREDLYYRLNVIPIKLAPLRERQGDIEPLTRFFIEKFSDTHNRPVRGISDEALSWLKRQPWRGNVRELKNLIERAILITSRSVLETGDFYEEIGGSIEGQAPVSSTAAAAEVFSLREMEKTMIHKALEKTNGNRTHAAEMLGISIRTLRNKLHEYKEGLIPGEPIEAF